MLGGEHPLWSWALPLWRCQGSALLAVSRPAGFLPAFVRGLRPVPEPTQPGDPSEHGRPTPCLCPGLSPRPPPWLELCRASVGAMGRGARAGLGSPGGGGHSVPSPRDCRSRDTGRRFPMDVRPHCGGSALGKGQGGRLGGMGCSAPAQLPHAWAADGGVGAGSPNTELSRQLCKNAISHGRAVNYRASVQRGVRHEGAFVSV